MRSEQQEAEEQRQKELARVHAEATKRAAAADAAVRAVTPLRTVPFGLGEGESIEAAGATDPKRRRPWLTSDRFLIVTASGAVAHEHDLDAEEAPAIRRVGLPRGCVQVRVGKKKYVLAPCDLVGEVTSDAADSAVGPTAVAAVADSPDVVGLPDTALAQEPESSGTEGPEPTERIDQMPTPVGASFSAERYRPWTDLAVWTAATGIAVLIGIIIVLLLN